MVVKSGRYQAVHRHIHRRALATSELNRALPPYQGGPFDRLGRGQQAEGEGVEPRDLIRPPRVFKARCRADGAPSRAESGELESQRLRAHPRSKRSPLPWRVHSPWGISRPV